MTKIGARNRTGKVVFLQKICQSAEKAEREMKEFFGVPLQQNEVH
jgi:NADH:ubiquinone oxidoreductase subunit C